MAYTKYSLTPSNNNAAPPDGAPEGMLPSAVNDTMRDMMAQIRDCGDGIRGGTYTMTAPVITGGSITGVALSGNTLTNPVITGGSINNTPIGASTASTGAFSTLSATGATTFSGTTVMSGSVTANTFASSGATITGGSINSTAIGGSTAAAGAFTTLSASGAFSANGGATLGDASGDALTINSSAVSVPNGLNFDSNTLVIDAANNAVGIGTSSPASTLAVQGTFSVGNGVSGSINYASTGALTIGSTAAEPLVFRTNSSERMRITSTGNVGIGTSSPDGKLNVAGLSATNGATKYVSRFETTDSFASGLGAGIVLAGKYNTAGSAAEFGSIMGIKENSTDGNYAGALTFQTRANGSQPSERMRIDSSGNVGLGTTTPQVKLAISDNSNGSYLGLSVTRSSPNFTSDITAQAETGGWVSAMRFLVGSNGTAATERMRIDSSGNVGIGTSPSGKLHVNSAAGANFIVGYNNTSVNYIDANTQIFRTGSFSETMRIDSSGNLLVGTTSTSTPTTGVAIASATAEIKLGHPNGTSSGYSYLVFAYDGSVIGSIAQNGTTAVAYNTSSDYRLKENIAPMQGALDTVAQLKPVTYNWKVDGSAGQGFIAHELQAVVPDCVTGEKDAVDEEGNPQYQGIDTSFLVATLTKAIQEQQTLIENLTTRLNALEGK